MRIVRVAFNLADPVSANLTGKNAQITSLNPRSHIAISTTC